MRQSGRGRQRGRQRDRGIHCATSTVTKEPVPSSSKNLNSFLVGGSLRWRGSVPAMASTSSRFRSLSSAGAISIPCSMYLRASRQSPFSISAAPSRVYPCVPITGLGTFSSLVFMISHSSDTAVCAPSNSKYVGSSVWKGVTCNSIVKPLKCASIVPQCSCAVDSEPGRGGRQGCCREFDRGAAEDV